MASTKLLVGFLGILLAFSPERCCSTSTTTSGTRWGSRRSTTSTSRASIMALEQSIVMGIALAYLFVRMLAESEEEDRRAERYGARVGLARARSTRRFASARAGTATTIAAAPRRARRRRAA